MHPEALILRRCYPVPVTFADTKRAMNSLSGQGPFKFTQAIWHAALKQVTGALDEVYAVVDGREVRVAVVMDAPLGGVGGRDEYATGGPEWRTSKRDVRNLLEVADEQG